MSDSRETDDNIHWFPNLQQFRKKSRVQQRHKFGFIVMDSYGTVFGTLSGNIREILHKFTVDLPIKNGRGGQAALARLQTEECQNYVRKTAELATQFYINSATKKPNVLGLILARSRDFKTELGKSGMFDPRLQAKILKVVDVYRGGEKGFIRAIKLSSDILAHVKLDHETRLVEIYLKEIERDTGKYVSGVKDTLNALAIGAVKTLIVWDNLDINRYVLQNSVSGDTSIHHFSKAEENDPKFRDLINNAEVKVLDKQSLIEWLATEYIQFGCAIEYVTEKSQQGSQFCLGYGGIGGVLRYQLDMRIFDDLSDEENNDDSAEQLVNGYSSTNGGCTGCTSTRPFACCQCVSLLKVCTLFFVCVHIP
ncbi:hypothetical protein MKW92_013266 [Papaver armeniacum]|nr:hypothetical protein MKW92_013266 [Papaver armeniacum]